MTEMMTASNHNGMTDSTKHMGQCFVIQPFNKNTWNMVGRRYQTNLSGVTFSGNGVVAPGGPF